MKIAKSYGENNNIICFYLQENDTPFKEILTIEHGNWRILYAGDKLKLKT